MLSKTDIEKYFIAEKQESLVFLIIGMIAILLAIIFYFSSKTTLLSRGAAIPLVLLGLIQAIAGYSVYVKSDDQRVSQVYAYDMNPDQLKTVELSRMRKVKTNFLIYRWIEMGATVAGIVLIILFRHQPDNKFWLGFGIAFTMMAAELFIADFIAEKRAFRYVGLLEEFNRPKV